MRRSNIWVLCLGFGAALSICQGARAAFFEVYNPNNTDSNGDSNYSPVAETVGNTRDSSTATKYLNFAKLNTGLVESPGASVITGITFTTGNDSPERDPLTFTLYGSNTVTVTGSETPGTDINIANFTQIAANVAITGFATDPGRNITVANQAISNSTSYSTYLLIFPTVRTPGTANSMQVDDVILTGASGNITLPTTPINGGLQVATPEPASLGLLGLGAAGLLARRRRGA